MGSFGTLPVSRHGQIPPHTWVFIILVSLDASSQYFLGVPMNGEGLILLVSNLRIVSQNATMVNINTSFAAFFASLTVIFGIFSLRYMLRRHPVVDAVARAGTQFGPSLLQVVSFVASIGYYRHLQMFHAD